MVDWGWYLLLVPAGFLAGIVNTIAGGGSFLTLPALMLLCGLDPKLANGTNRVAILFSSLSASATFHKHGHLDKVLATRLMIPTLVGAPVGALLAIYLPAAAFQSLFGVIFLGMEFVFMLDPKRLLRKVEPERQISWRLTVPIFFGIGVYVGFIQAGMGILLLLAMSFMSTGDLLASNAVKNMIGFVVTLAATIIFVVYGMVDWVPALVTAAGNVAGGIVGAKLAIKKGNKLIFGFLVVVMLATGTKLLFSSFNAE